MFTIIETRAHFPRLLQDRRRPPVSTGMKAILVKHEKFNCTSLLGGAENHTAAAFYFKIERLLLFYCLQIRSLLHWVGPLTNARWHGDNNPCVKTCTVVWLSLRNIQEERILSFLQAMHKEVFWGIRSKEILQIWW